MKYRRLNDLSSTSSTPIFDILRARGIEQPEHFLRPTKESELDPKDLLHMEEGAKLLLRHLEEDSRILLVVDCDQDGLSAGAILWLYCKRIFPNSKLSFTVHEGKQHGLEDHMGWLEEDDEYSLIVCPDSSSMDFEYHERLHRIGKDILVLDHHHTERDSQYAVVINNQLSPSYDNKSLCGAGVVYKFCQYLDKITSNSFSAGFLDLVALAEVGDMMDLRHPETRYYVNEGLKNITNGGFRALLEKQSYSIKNVLLPTPTDLSFYIVPLVNALIRVGTREEKETMFWAFVDGNRLVPSTKRGAKLGDTETAAGQTARVAENARARQNRTKEKACDILERQIVEKDLLKNKLLILEFHEEDRIPLTLTGLIASYFVGKYRRPTLVVRKSEDGFLRGSGRGSDTFDIPGGLKTLLLESKLMEFSEGHLEAFGLGLPEKNYEALLTYANANLQDEMLVENTYYVDYVFNSTDDFHSIGEEISQYSAIWGQGIQEPTIVIKDLKVGKNEIFKMGANKDSVKFSSGGVDFVKFKDTDFVELLESQPYTSLTVYGKFNLNEFAGRTSTQFFILDYSAENWYNVF